MYLCLLVPVIISHLWVSRSGIYTALYLQTLHHSYTYRGHRQFGKIEHVSYYLK